MPETNLNCPAEVKKYADLYANENGGARPEHTPEFIERLRIRSLVQLTEDPDYICDACNPDKYRYDGKEIHGTRVEIDGTRVEIDGTRFEIDGTRFEIDGTRVEIDGTRVEIDETTFEIDETPLTSVDFEPSSVDFNFRRFQLPSISTYFRRFRI